MTEELATAVAEEGALGAAAAAATTSVQTLESEPAAPRDEGPRGHWRLGFKVLGVRLLGMEDSRRRYQLRGHVSGGLTMTSRSVRTQDALVPLTLARELHVGPGSAVYAHLVSALEPADPAADPLAAATGTHGLTLELDELTDSGGWLPVGRVHLPWSRLLDMPHGQSREVFMRALDSPLDDSAACVLEIHNELLLQRLRSSPLPQLPAATAAAASIAADDGSHSARLALEISSVSLLATVRDVRAVRLDVQIGAGIFSSAVQSRHIPLDASGRSTSHWRRNLEIVRDSSAWLRLNTALRSSDESTSELSVAILGVGAAGVRRQIGVARHSLRRHLRSGRDVSNTALSILDARGAEVGLVWMTLEANAALEMVAPALAAPRALYESLAETEARSLRCAIRLQAFARGVITRAHKRRADINEGVTDMATVSVQVHELVASTSVAHGLASASVRLELCGLHLGVATPYRMLVGATARFGATLTALLPRGSLLFERCVTAMRTGGVCSLRAIVNVEPAKENAGVAASPAHSKMAEATLDLMELVRSGEDLVEHALSLKSYGTHQPYGATLSLSVAAVAALVEVARTERLPRPMGEVRTASALLAQRLRATLAVQARIRGRLARVRARKLRATAYHQLAAPGNEGTAARKSAIGIAYGDGSVSDEIFLSLAELKEAAGGGEADTPLESGTARRGRRGRMTTAGGGGGGGGGSRLPPDCELALEITLGELGGSGGDGEPLRRSPWIAAPTKGQAARLHGAPLVASSISVDYGSPARTILRDALFANTPSRSAVHVRLLARRVASDAGFYASELGVGSLNLLELAPHNDTTDAQSADLTIRGWGGQPVALVRVEASGLQVLRLLVQLNRMRDVGEHDRQPPELDVEAFSGDGGRRLSAAVAEGSPEGGAADGSGANGMPLDMVDAVSGRVLDAATGLASHCGSFRVCDFYSNPLPSQILEVLYGAPTLTSLDLSYCLGLARGGQGEDDAEPFAAALTHLHQLTRLDMCSCDLLDDGAALVVRATVASPESRIEVLRLRANRIGPAGVSALALALATTETLRELDLGDNLLGDEGLQRLCGGVEATASAAAPKGNRAKPPSPNRSPRRGRLSAAAAVARFSGAAAESSTSSSRTEADRRTGLAANRSLRLLMLSNNRIGAGSLRTLAVALEAHGGIEEIDMSVNPLEDEAASEKSNKEAIEAFGSALGSLKALSGVRLRHSHAPSDSLGLCISQVILGDADRGLRMINLQGSRLSAAGLRSIIEAVLPSRAAAAKGDAVGALPPPSVPPAASVEVLNLEGCLANARSSLDDLWSLVAHPLCPLRRLMLGLNQLDEEDGAKLGGALASNTSLHALDLSSNPLGGAGVSALARGLAVAVQRRSSALEHLGLDYCGAGVDGAVALAELLASSKCPITSLTLCANGLGAEGIRELAAAFGNGQRIGSQLRRLRLEDNRLDSEGAAESLARIAARGARLDTLRLRGNALSELHVSTLVRGVGSSSSLRTLDLADCAIGAAGLHALLEAARQQSMLRSLGLEGCSLGDGGAVTFANALELLGTLRFASVARNGIGVDGGRALAVAMEDCEALRALDVSGNPAILYHHSTRIRLAGLVRTARAGEANPLPSWDSA